MAEQDQENREFGPTYKSLFLGACIVIGSTFGWWLTNFIAATESIHAKHEHRIAELEARALRETWEREAIRDQVDALLEQGKHKP